MSVLLTVAAISFSLLIFSAQYMKTVICDCVLALFLCQDSKPEISLSYHLCLFSSVSYSVSLLPAGSLTRIMSCP